MFFVLIFMVAANSENEKYLIFTKMYMYSINIFVFITKYLLSIKNVFILFLYLYTNDKYFEQQIIKNPIKHILFILFYTNVQVIV